MWASHLCEWSIVEECDGAVNEAPVLKLYIYITSDMYSGKFGLCKLYLILNAHKETLFGTLPTMWARCLKLWQPVHASRKFFVLRDL